MHRLPSHATLRRFRIASLLVVLMFLAVPMAIAASCYAFVSGSHVWFVAAGGMVAAGLIAMVLNLILSSRLRCPLCMVPPLLNRRCSKHRNAPTMFGSHRLVVAKSILFRDNFRCPYCGEPTAMQVRERARR